MAAKPEFADTVQIKNGMGTDGTPYRLVNVDSNGYFVATSAAGGDFVGVLMADERYVDKVTPSLKYGTVKTAGAVEITCNGSVTCGHWVKVADNVGKIADAGTYANLSSGATKFKLVGVALEDGVDGSRVTVALQPMIIPA
jgi:hypothetical protein